MILTYSKFGVVVMLRANGYFSVSNWNGHLGDHSGWMAEGHPATIMGITPLMVAMEIVPSHHHHNMINYKG